MVRRALLVAWIVIALLACDTTPGAGTDTGTGLSGGTDAGLSGGTDAGLSGGTDAGARDDSGPYMGGDPTSGCEGRLMPVTPSGTRETVGDGTSASCTEEALHAAVGRLNDGGGGTLDFDCGGEHTITLTRSVRFDASATLDGGGQITLSGGNAVRVIELDHHLDFVIQRITVRDGFVAAGSENESGAGLLSPWFGTLRVIDCTFENNHSASVDHDVGGGAIYAGGLTEAIVSGSTFTGNSGSTGGGVLSRSTNLRVIDSVFYENSATTYAESGQYGNGGGLYIDRMWLDAPIDFVICGSVFERNHAKVHGSAFFSYNLEGTRAVFDRCTFRDNDMEGSPGGTGSVYHQGVPLVLLRSTFAGNTTNAHAGGLFLGGGTDAEIRECTFVGNETPGNAGGLWAGNGSVVVSHTTFAENRGDYAPAIFAGSSGTVRLTDCLFWNNGTDNEFSAVACHETFEDGGGNVQWPEVKNNGNRDTACAEGVLFADAMPMTLADNGGAVPTMAIGAESPASGHGTDCSSADARGTARSAPCDSGAYEHVP